MARLRRSERSGDGDRAQFLLLGAFGLAVILLVFAGVLNTVAYTENLTAAPGDQPTSRDVDTLQEDVRRGLGGLMARVNDDAAAYSTKADRFARGVANWSRGLDREYVLGVTGVGVSVRATTEGRRVAQSTVRPLTNASGAGNWTLAASVPDVRRFRLVLDRGSLADGPCAGGCYGVVVDDGDTTWRVSINQSAVSVDGPGGGRCPVGSDPVTVDLTGGTVDGRPCDPLRFAGGLEQPYAIGYRNGGNATGTYHLVVNATGIADADYNASGSPSVSPAIYDAAVNVTYRSPQLSYGSVIRIARGEPDG